MTRGRRRALVAIVACASIVALALPVGAIAAGANDDREARAQGFCSGTSRSSLRVRADDGSIRIELRVDTRRRGAVWNVVLLHERRIVFRGALRTSGSRGSLRLRRMVPDLFGQNTIVVRVTGPRREICRVSVRI
ncbi:MAG TPA: hypothetical protein VK926_07890 [Gaiellaceae bacterium]|nr:hypothetical protein [Gaiellaceae bacterium]